MFTINNLTVNYGKKRVLSNLSMEIDTCSITGIIGYNGAGKTTLLNSIFGLIDASRESFLLNGVILKRTQIGYLETQNFFYSNITGNDYLKLFQQKNSNFDIELWNNIFDLPLNEIVENYSTGMKKKLALLGILALDKEIIILDEPFNGLDIESVLVLQMILQRLVLKNKTIIISSHIIETLTTICSSIHLLKDGIVCNTYHQEEFDVLMKSIHSEVNVKYNAKIEVALL